MDREQNEERDQAKGGKVGRKRRHKADEGKRSMTIPVFCASSVPVYKKKLPSSMIEPNCKVLL